MATKKTAPKKSKSTTSAAKPAAPRKTAKKPAATAEKAELKAKPSGAKSTTVKTVVPKSKRKATPKSLKGFKPVQAEIIDPAAAPSGEEATDHDEEFRPVDGELHDDGLHAGGLDPAVDEETLDVDSDDTPARDVAAIPEFDSTDDLPSTALTSADPMTRYMAEVGRYKILTREEERELATRYRETGDPKAAEKLVTANLRFVVKVAAEYMRFGARLIDLVQEGNVGLMHAVKEFNPYKGTRLITYAVWWIRGYIQEYLMRQYSMVRIGTTATQRKLFYQLQKQKEELERMGVELGIAQLSGKLGVPVEEVQAMHSRLSGRDVSLDAPVSEDGSTRLLDLQSEADPHALDEELGNREEVGLLREKLEELRPSLNEREQFLLDARLLSDEPLTLQEIGDKYGTTREAVRQMEARLMAKIKRSLVEETES